jgi:ATP-binding cassette subfamily F protein uup
VATSILAFEGEGRVIRYPGNFESYRTLKAQVEEARAPQPAVRPPPPRGGIPSSQPARRPGKLSFKEQRELQGIESAIEEAERHKAEAEAALADPSTYATQAARVPELQAQLDQATAEVERLYARWQALQDLL